MEPAFSIIIPFYNEEENVVSVLEEVKRSQPDAEIIAIDDGSTDSTYEKMRTVPGIRCLKPAENRGQSAAMYAGMVAARAPVIGLMDGDGQNDPADFARLLKAMQDNDVVVGYRAKRKDTFSRRAASKIANKIRRMFLTDGVRDTGCSLKVFRKEAVQYLVPFNGLHRYLPAIFTKAGLSIAEVPVNHRARTAGVSKYTNWERGLRGAYDLIGVSWLLKRKVHYTRIEDTTND